MHPNVPLPQLPATFTALRQRLGPLVSFFLSSAMFTALLAATVCVWLLVRTNAEDKAQAEFAAKAAKIADAVQERLTGYEQALWGAAGLVAAVPTLTREQWKIYVSSLSVRQRLPGVQSVAFTKRVTPQERDAYIAAIRAQGSPDYTIWPEGVREEYTAISFSEPSDPANRRALGYDMFAEPVRHAAMVEARDTGRAVLSGKVKLVQQTGSDEQPGFLIFVPVYRDAAPADTVEQRRTALLGYVFSPFRAEDFIATALQHTPETIAIEVYDGATIDQAALLYRSPLLAAIANPTAQFNYEGVTQLALGRHQWTVRLVSLPGYVPTAGQQEAWIVLAAGILLSLIAAAVVNSLGASRKRTRKLNEELQADIALRREIEQRLRTAEDTLRDAVDSISEAFVIFDAEDRLVLCNEAFRRLYPASAEVLKPGITFENILRDGLKKGIHVDAVGREEEWLADRIRRHSNTSGAVETPLGDGRWALVRERRMRNGGIAGLRIDITQLKNIETQLRETTEAAQAANVVKSQFLANMSHELRTPLNAIIGFSETLELGIAGHLQPKQVEYVGLIRQSGKHLHAVINDILDLAKVDAGKFELNEEPGIDPRSIVDACVALMKSNAIAHSLQLTTEIEDRLPCLRADPTRLKQILLNLISNAIKFTGAGGSVAVAVRRNASGGIAFAVQDTGPGMTAQEIETALEPFGQVRNGHTRRHEGTGLGLPLALRMAELHGGSLVVDSEKGRGTTITVTLPAARVDVEPMQVAVAEDACFVLAADDEPPTFAPARAAT
jgi:signal transduction histidine kinase